MAKCLTREIDANGMVFRARFTGAEGPSGEPVILLHGFPETSIMWAGLMERLGEEGYRCFAPDQRGYSPGARPGTVEDYQYRKLVSDVMAQADALGYARFHLIGHDWGSAIGWVILQLHPDRVRSWTAMSVPHMDAFASAIADDPDQRQRSRYLGFFMLPERPEQGLTADDFAALRSLWSSIPRKQVDEYVGVFSQAGALTAALNWYRANAVLLEKRREGPKFGPVLHPTLLIWGNRDIAVGRVAVERTAQHMKGPYRLVELNAGHWLVQEEPERVHDEILSHLKSNPL
ncbi:MAG TPA: alpha/beta hydrolase [Dehalococcoidia bacterium]|nr:alpha/beta hydrolase [Dehalococcoidia bacterium]